MLNIKVRRAAEDERLNIDSEAEDLPEGVIAYDGTDWEHHFLAGLREGDWVVEIDDPEDILQWQQPGRFFVHAGGDSGYLKRIPSWSVLEG